jgi:hypothetical protein
MTEPIEKSVEERAEEQAQGASSAVSYMTKHENYVEGYKMGHASRDPEVLALRAENERLKNAIEFAMETFIDQINSCNCEELCSCSSDIISTLECAVTKINTRLVSGVVQSDLTAHKEMIGKLEGALNEMKGDCEWYTSKGTDQERHHFVAVELVHAFETHLDALKAFREARG